MAGAIYREKDRLILNLKVQPRAKKDEIVGLQGELIKVRIKAPPVDGKANAYLLKFMAKTFGVSQSRIKLVRGESNREKCISIDRPEKIPDCLKPLLL